MRLNVQQLLCLVHQAWINMLAHRLRSALAVLGLTIGSASVVALLYCSQLATLAVIKQLSELGTNLLSVSIIGQHDHNTISLTALEKLVQDNVAISEYAPVLYSYSAARYNGKKLSASVVGSTESLQTIAHLTLAAGRFISDFDQDPFCVIGANVAVESGSSILNKQIKLGNRYCTVVGILNHAPSNFFIPVDFDSVILLPASVSIHMYKDSRIQDVILSLQASDDVQKVEGVFRQQLLTLAPKLRYFFRNPQSLIDKVVEQKRSLTLLLGVVGSIALLVGGIGIMNIMLVSVVERRREIGLRLALGARVRNIQDLFLIEAIVLAVSGGLLGVGLGWTFSLSIAFFAGWSFAFLLSPLILGFGVALLVGVFFGYYPAYKAAQLQPVETLRYE